MQMWTYPRKLLTGFKNFILYLQCHECETPPDELMAVIARLDGDNLWEQRRCTACGKISHWKRDTPDEPFDIWVTAAESFVPGAGDPGGTPIRIDLSEKDLRKHDQSQT